MTVKVATRQIVDGLEDLVDRISTDQLIHLAETDPAMALDKAQALMSAFRLGGHRVRDHLLRVAYAAAIEMHRDPLKRAAAAKGYREKKKLPERVDTLRLAIRRLYNVRDVDDARYSTVCKWANALQASFDNDVEPERLPDIIRSGGIHGLLQNRKPHQAYGDDPEPPPVLGDRHGSPREGAEKQRPQTKPGRGMKARKGSAVERLSALPTDLIVAGGGFLETILSVPRDRLAHITIRNTGLRADGLIGFKIESID